MERSTEPSASEDLVHSRPRQRAVGLTPRAARTVRAVVEAVYARRERDGEALTPPPEERVVWVVSELDDFLARVTPRTYAILLVSLFALSTLAPFFVRRFGSLASLPLEERVRALEAVEKSGLAPALLAVKAFLSMHYYEHPDAAREVGFTGHSSMVAGPKAAPTAARSGPPTTKPKPISLEVRP